jgi:hypothetical protein
MLKQVVLEIAVHVIVSRAGRFQDTVEVTPAAGKKNLRIPFHATVRSDHEIVAGPGSRGVFCVIREGGSKTGVQRWRNDGVKRLEGTSGVE